MATYTFLGGDGNWATATNWSPTSPAGGPGAGSDVILDQTAATALNGGDLSGVGTLNSLTIYSTFTQTVGIKGTPLKVNVTTVRIGDPSGSQSPGTGSQRINLDLATATSTVTIVATAANSADSGLEPVRIKGGSNTSAFTCEGGTIGIATDTPGDVSQPTTIYVQPNSIVRVGSSASVGTIVNNGGTITTYAAVTNTIETLGGTTITIGNYTIPTVKVYGGVFDCRNRPSGGANTITILAIQTGHFDTRGDGSSVIINNATLYAPGGTITAFSDGQITFSNLFFNFNRYTSLAWSL